MLNLDSLEHTNISLAKTGKVVNCTYLPFSWAVRSDSKKAFIKQNCQWRQQNQPNKSSYKQICCFLLKNDWINLITASCSLPLRWPAAHELGNLLPILVIVMALKKTHGWESEEQLSAPRHWECQLKPLLSGFKLKREQRESPRKTEKGERTVLEEIGCCKRWFFELISPILNKSEK